MAYVLDDPGLAHRSAGEEFVFAVARRSAAADDVEVELGVVLTTVFPLAATRPRYTVRHLCRSITAPASHPRGGGNGAPARRETPRD